MKAGVAPFRTIERPSSTGKAVSVFSAPAAAACMLITTFWPCPDRSRSRCASMLPTAASAPAKKHACGTLTCSGGRSGVPCRIIIPLAAQPTMSVARHAAPGPRSPNGVTEV